MPDPEPSSSRDRSSPLDKGLAGEQVRMVSAESIIHDAPEITLSSASIEGSELRANLGVEVFSLKELLSKDRERTLQLIQEYHDHLVRSFPDPNQVVPLFAYEPLLAHHVNWDVTVVFYGGNLVAGMDGHFFPAAGRVWGVVEHIFVDSDFRGKELQLGKRIYEDFVSSARLHAASGVLAEIEDPFLLTDEESRHLRDSGISPETRRDWWARRGHLVFDAPYEQAPTSDGGEPVLDVMLTVKPLDPTLSELSKSEFLDIVRAYYSQFIGGPEMTKKSFDRLVLQLAEVERVALQPLDQRRSFLEPV